MITAAFIEAQFANQRASKDSLRVENVPAYVLSADDGRISDLDSEISNTAEPAIQSPNLTAAGDSSRIAASPEEWTPKLEDKFRKMAQYKALNRLDLPGKVEFERLQSIRRQLKNPRTGEEVLLEYQQRMITKGLVNALSQYVQFHKTSNRSGQTAKG